MYLFMVFTLLLILAIGFPKSKELTLAILLYMFFVYSFVYFKGDLQEYEAMYATDVSGIEFGYLYLMKLGQLLHIPYQGFRTILGIIYVTLTCIAVCKSTKYQNLVLILLAIFPLTVFASIVRQGLAYSIISLGFTYLFDKDEKHGILKYVICVMIAFSIHYSSILFLLFVISKFKFTKIKAVFTICVSFLMFMVLLNHERVMSILGTIGNLLNKESIFKYATGQVDAPNLIGKISIVFVYMISLLISCFAYYWSKKKYEKVETSELVFSERTCATNVYMLILVPFMFNSMVFLRFLYMLSTINMINLANAIEIDKRLSRSSQFRYCAIFLGVVSMIIMYVYFMLPYHTQGTLFFDYLFNTKYVWEI